MICQQCEKEFTPTKHGGRTPQKYCSARCRVLASKERIAAQKEAERQRKEAERRREEYLRELASKSLDDWIHEAAECRLDYGTYRSLRYMGKTFDELKADADKRPVTAHHRKVKSLIGS